MNQAAPAGAHQSQRLASIDVARFLGITLVFFGHLVEQVMYLDNPAAAAQYKWVYSFHMPLFFLLAGVAFNNTKIRVGPGEYLKQRWTGRLVPYFVFTFLMGALALVIPGWFPLAEGEALTSVQDYVHGTISTVMGMPAFNIPLWFLACLVSVEIFHYLVGRLWTTKTRIAIGAVAFYLFGYYLNRNVDFFELEAVFWLVHLVPLGYAFYLTGMLLRSSGILERDWPLWGVVAGALACIVAVHLTYDLNQGPFRWDFDAVIFLIGAPGHVLLFPLTALIGITGVLLIGRLLAGFTFLQYLGKITLLIYCLHGFFYHFVNPPVAALMVEYLPDAAWSILLFTTLGTVLSVAATIPVAMVIMRYVPVIAGGTVRAARQ